MTATVAQFTPQYCLIPARQQTAIQHTIGLYFQNYKPQIAGQAVPCTRDYKRKYEYLKQQLKKPSNVPNKIEIKVRNLSIGRERTGLYDVSVFQVRRNKILKDSYRQINSIPSSKVH